ncbi:MAG: hypothetical protein WDO56_27740 [Gammaproteobacteria bacterium]
MELKAPLSGLATGIIVEASIEKGRGAVATVLVKKGTLKVGDPIIAGSEFGRVRAMFDETGASVQEAGAIHACRRAGACPAHRMRAMSLLAVEKRAQGA